MIKKKINNTLNARAKYNARLNALSRYTNEFQSHTERLLGPNGYRWENLIKSCVKFRKQYSSLSQIYDERLDDIFKKIQSDKIQNSEYIAKAEKVLDDSAELYLQIENELDERIKIVKKMKSLLERME